MNPHRPTSWLAVAGVPLLVLAGLTWLLVVFAGNRSQVHSLPDTAENTVEYYEDVAGRLSVGEAKGLPENAWRKLEAGKFTFAKRGNVLWMRITLVNPSGEAIDGILENDDYFADRMDAWVSTDGEDRHLISGEGVATAPKAIAGRELAVPVNLPPGGRRVIYLRLDDLFGAYARPVWWPDSSAFHIARAHAGLAEGIYLGGLLALLGYNILLWSRLRQADIGWYSLYLGLMAVFMFLARAQLPALGFALGSPGLEILLTFVMVAGACVLTRFARTFLETQTSLPRADKWLHRWCWLVALLAFSILITPGWHWLRTAILVMTITHLGLTATAVAAWRAGVRQARYFILSFGCLFASSLPLIGVWFFESTLRDAAMRGLMIGSALEMLLLSLAVADRFARAQRLLVEETEQRRMMEEAYADELEEEVRERTRELQAANADKDRMLAVIGHDLRSPLTGLMRSADGASGEFPRDVTRTVRALLLMIEDLVLWARLRAGKPAIAIHEAGAVMRPAVALHRALAEHADVELILEVPEALQVSTDLVLTQTLARNLLANALKFARTRVVLRAEASKDGVRFTVGNDGPPLSPEVAARFAANEDEPMTATGGMGLRLGREICQALGLKLDVRFGEEGTEFGFTLPTPQP